MTARLRLLIDSADRTALAHWLESGFVEGFTTNPKLLAAAGVKWADLPDLAAFAVPGLGRTIFLQTWGASLAELRSNADRLLAIAPEAVVKIPCNEEGVRLASELKIRGIRTLLTAIYTPAQMLVATAVGADWVAPYYDRALRAGRPALDTMRALLEVAPQDSPDSPIILAASLKSAEQVVELARAGVRAFTLSPEVLSELLPDPLTQQATAEFETLMASVLA